MGNIGGMGNKGSAGNVGDSGSAKSTGGVGGSGAKRAPDAPIEHVKKFEDALEKRKDSEGDGKAGKGEVKDGSAEGPFNALKGVSKTQVSGLEKRQGSKEEGLKGGKGKVEEEGAGGPFNALKSMSKIQASGESAKLEKSKKEEPSDLVKDQVVKEVIEKEKGEVKLGGEEEGKEKKSVVLEVLKNIGAEGKVKSEKKHKGEEEDVEGSLASVQGQQPAVGPLGQVASAASAQPVMPSTAAKEVAELVAAMIDKIMVTNTELSAGKEVRMTFSDAITSNSNLKNVEVVIKKEGGALTITFNTVKNPDAGNYISQNLDTLNTGLQNKISDVQEIHIDIKRGESDTHQDDRNRRSRGEYLDEEGEES